MPIAYGWKFFSTTGKVCIPEHEYTSLHNLVRDITTGGADGPFPSFILDAVGFRFLNTNIHPSLARSCIPFSIDLFLTGATKEHTNNSHHDNAAPSFASTPFIEQPLYLAACNSQRTPTG